jgi:hypothetical protein
MNKQIITFAATVEGLASRKDKTLTVRFSTQELAPEKSAELFGLQNALVYVAVKVEDFNKAELEMLEKAKADAVEFGTKTASRRLRDVLYILWQQNPDGYRDSNSHYEAKMEKIIAHYKNQLL